MCACVRVRIYARLVINGARVCIQVNHVAGSVSAGNEECNATSRNTRVEFILAISPFA